LLAFWVSLLVAVFAGAADVLVDRFSFPLFSWFSRIQRSLNNCGVFNIGRRTLASSFMNEHTVLVFRFRLSGTTYSSTGLSYFSRCILHTNKSGGKCN